MILRKLEDKLEWLLFLMLVLAFGLIFLIDRIIIPEISAPQVSLIINF
ncbi:hypothetical protein SAMN06265182_0433 [Persephonella hydrogeniphila]|uniref:Uncharacterized protein n=1 Tax=Persephonella hydrogeniphila TaxID=198703 RepID=A0A285N2I8_9AQUI|nr:hypothetical protein SAMN06265182_0433 [Persephonella hydrogeniphila]